MRKILSVATTLTILLAIENQAQAKLKLPDCLQNLVSKITRKQRHLQEDVSQNKASLLSHQNDLTEIENEESAIHNKLPFSRGNTVNTLGKVQQDSRIDSLIKNLLPNSSKLILSSMPEEQVTPMNTGKVLSKRDSVYWMNYLTTELPEQESPKLNRVQARVMKHNVLDSLDKIIENEERTKRFNPLSSFRGLKGKFNNEMLSAALAVLGQNPFGTLRGQVSPSGNKSKLNNFGKLPIQVEVLN